MDAAAGWEGGGPTGPKGAGTGGGEAAWGIWAMGGAAPTPGSAPTASSPPWGAEKAEEALDVSYRNEPG